MNRQISLWVTLVVAVLVAGCGESAPGTPLDLGAVPYQPAFAAGREVMAQYFSVASADPDTGVIQCRPKSVQERPERILSGSPARKVAAMRLDREGATVMAYVSVAIERLGSTEHRHVGMTREKYDSVPNQTPAEADAASSPEQREVWTIDRYDHELERKILRDLYKRMHPIPKQ